MAKQNETGSAAAEKEFRPSISANAFVTVDALDVNYYDHETRMAQRAIQAETAKGAGKGKK